MTGEGRRCVVSGGGTGIGKVIAESLAADGDRVVIIGRRKDVLESAAQGINSELGAELVSWQSADLTKPEEVSAAAEAITADGTPVDVLVNNAGGHQGEPTGDGAMEDLADVAAYWQRNFEANVLPTVLLTRALLPHLRRPGGRVLAIGSMAAFGGHGGRAGYGAAKAAVHGWACALTRKLAPEGITINVVAPGRVLVPRSAAAARLTEELRKDALRDIPAGRLGTAGDIAATIHYLASPEAGYITGQILQVNGGMVLGRG